ncbi:hypothetical protein CDL12_18235 [Handroanthus impetiginosus]|uniref:Pollen allergen Ole e 1 family n=1 Tax=Handroanthus impetiginosus TaxID=429701 RepID=A0A2G9GV71_9LAMI|nr:hypothetical protein CDL12_18235 [Handroanthus impetiginosus]
MNHIFGHNSITRMIFIIFAVFVFLETPAIASTGELSLSAAAELLSGSEELVKWAGYGEEKLSTVVVGGKLLCHGSGAKERTTVHPYPVSGATVAVLCGKSGTRTKKSWAKGSTDSSGNFLIDLPSHLHAIPNLEKICHIKVVHLPKGSPCRQACTRKLKRMELTSFGEGIRSYTTHNIHLTPQKHT